MAAAATSPAVARVPEWGARQVSMHRTPDATAVGRWGRSRRVGRAVSGSIHGSCAATESCVRDRNILHNLRLRLGFGREPLVDSALPTVQGCNEKNGGCRSLTEWIAGVPRFWGRRPQGNPGWISQRFTGARSRGSAGPIARIGSVGPVPQSDWPRRQTIGKAGRRCRPRSFLGFAGGVWMAWLSVRPPIVRRCYY